MTHPVPPVPDGRQLLRHTLATLAYRASKAVRGAPPSFSTFLVADGSRTPGQILAHLGDLMDWALSQAKGQQKWTDTAARRLERRRRPLLSLGLRARRVSRVGRRRALRRDDDLSGCDRRLADARRPDQHAASHRSSPVRGENYARGGHRGRPRHARTADAARRVRLTRHASRRPQRDSAASSSASVLRNGASPARTARSPLVIPTTFTMASDRPIAIGSWKT